MKKALVLFAGDIYSRRGYFNAVVSRTKYLQEISDFSIDILVLSTYEPWYVRKLRHTPRVPCPERYEIDGLNMKIDWRRFSIVDYILHVKMLRSEVFSKLHINRLVYSLKGYDLVIAHSTLSGCLAQMIKRKYGTPYTVTWHGSDIHSEPFNNPSSLQPTIDVIRNADMNFFVSKALLKMSERLIACSNKKVLYNGVIMLLIRKL